MNHDPKARARAVACLTVIGALWCAACEAPHHELPLHQESDELHAETVVRLVPRTPYLETFSCQVLCHQPLLPNPERRDLTEFHTVRPLSHGPAITWCRASWANAGAI